MWKTRCGSSNDFLIVIPSDLCGEFVLLTPTNLVSTELEFLFSTGSMWGTFLLGDTLMVLLIKRL